MSRQKSISRKSIVALVLFFISTGAAFTQQSPESDKAQGDFISVSPTVRLWGAGGDLTLFRADANDEGSRLWLRANAAYGSINYFRSANLELPGSFVSMDQTSLNRWNLQGGLGWLYQARVDASRPKHDLEILAAWYTWWDEYNLPLFGDSTYASSLLAQSSEPAKSTLFENHFLIDAYLDELNMDDSSKNRSGFAAELGIEYAPLGMSIPQSVSFLRFAGNFKAFIPLFQNLTPENWNLISAYLGFNVSADFLVGLGTDATSGIPSAVSSRFGGRWSNDGLGGQLRGLPGGWGDGVAKAVVNVEYRMPLPAILHKDIVPGLFAFSDVGVMANPPAVVSGLKLLGAWSVGIGLFLDVLDFASVNISTGVLPLGGRPDGELWVPVMVEFNFHF